MLGGPHGGGDVKEGELSCLGGVQEAPLQS